MAQSVNSIDANVCKNSGNLRRTWKIYYNSNTYSVYYVRRTKNIIAFMIVSTWLNANFCSLFLPKEWEREWRRFVFFESNLFLFLCCGCDAGSVGWWFLYIRTYSSFMYSSIRLRSVFYHQITPQEDSPSPSGRQTIISPILILINK